MAATENDWREPEPRLTIELVPRPCWEINVRNAVPRKDWEVLRHRVYDEAGNRCEVCGGRGVRPALHCHEVWEYDDEQHVQRLVRMAALCPSCHAVKHIGSTGGLGSGSNGLRRALRRLAEVNEWTLAQARSYVADAFKRWRERSAHEWELDLDALRAYGVDPATVHRVCIEQRAERRRMPHMGPGRPGLSNRDAETGAELWLCEGCGRRGVAPVKTGAFKDLPAAMQEGLRTAIPEGLRRRLDRFNPVVTQTQHPPGWKREGSRVLCGSCVAADSAS